MQLIGCKKSDNTSGYTVGTVFWVFTVSEGWVEEISDNPGTRSEKGIDDLNDMPDTIPGYSKAVARSHDNIGSVKSSRQRCEEKEGGHPV